MRPSVANRPRICPKVSCRIFTEINYPLIKIVDEELLHDRDGQLLTGTFMEYALPRADQVPPLLVGHLDFPSAINPLGIKGVGESGIIAPAAAIANAVEDALADYGVEVDRVPVTSARIFELLRSTGHWLQRTRQLRA